MYSSGEIIEYADLVEIRIIFISIAFVMSVILGLLTVKISRWIGQPILHKIFNFPIGILIAKLDRTSRSKAMLIARGGFVLFVLSTISFTIGAFIQSLTEDAYFINPVQIIILLGLILTASSWVIVWNIYKELKGTDKVDGAYYTAAKSTRCDLNSVDNHGITRLSMSFLPISFDKYFVAPVFWYAISGLSGLFLYSAISFLALSSGKEGFTKGFGVIALWLEKIMGYIPNKISSICILIACLFTPKAKLFKALSQENKAPYFQGGTPVTFFAGALGVTLGGASKDIDGSSIQRKWVGNSDNSAKISPDHIKRAIYLILLSNIVFITLLFLVNIAISL